MAEVTRIMEANNIYIVALGILLLVLFALAYFIFRSRENEISCWQLISSRGADGRQYADIDKVGKVLLLMFFLSREIYLTYLGRLDYSELLLFVLYTSAISTFSAYMRAKAGLPPETSSPTSVTTTTTTEVKP